MTKDNLKTAEEIYLEFARCDCLPCKEDLIKAIEYALQRGNELNKPDASGSAKDHITMAAMNSDICMVCNKKRDEHLR